MALTHHELDLFSSVAVAREALIETGLDALVVTDRGRPIGIVSRSALAGSAGHVPRGDAAVGDVMEGEVVLLAPDADVATTLKKYRQAAWDSVRRRQPGASDDADRRAAAYEN
jgi:predicted transcriptional regulator